MSDRLTDFDVTPAAGYAGDVSADTAWRLLHANPEARLIDVRTTAEWNYVGLPDLSSLGLKPLLVEWQSFPTMAVDPDFVARVQQATASTAGPLLFICRSGVRSASAARAMTQGGRDGCFNVADGFEGPLDAHKHRGGLRGWKASGLPWIQG